MDIRRFPYALKNSRRSRGVLARTRLKSPISLQKKQIKRSIPEILLYQWFREK
jgi:hypothetical protein